MSGGVASEMPTIDSAINNALAEARIVGVVVMVARDGKIAYRRAAGFADREHAVAMREAAVFRLASVTKPFVTAAALRLVELGEISLSDPVSRFLPNFRPALASGEIPKITLRHLVTHTAGLSYGFLEAPDGSYHRAGVSDGLDQPGLSMADNLGRIARAGLAYAPGDSWAYSVAIDVLGAVLEAVEGHRLGTAVAKYVTRPLGLSATGFDLVPEQRSLLVTQYCNETSAPVRIPDTGLRVYFPPNIPHFAGLAGLKLAPERVFDQASFHSGGGGMNGTAGDVLKFIEVLRAGGGPILSRKTTRAMMMVQTGDLPIAIRGPGWAFGYGGAVLTDPAAAQSPQSIGTFAWGGVWGHHWFIDPLRRLSVVSLSNTAFEGMNGQYARDLRDAVITAFDT